MKKIIALIIVASLILTLVSCGSSSSNVSCVYIEGSSLLSTSICYTIYLYSFKNAEINAKYESTSSTEKPSSSGYIYSTEKLNVGDAIKVWNEFKFGEKTSSWTDDRQYGVNAIVDKIVAAYKITVKATSDTYIITYYSVEGSISNTSVSKKENLKEIQMKKMEVSKDRAIIEYYTN